MKDQLHEDVMVEEFRNDPAYAISLINAILADGADQGELLVTLRQMSKAAGGIPLIAEKAQVNRSHLYRALSKGGNPEIRSLTAILKAMGLRLAVEPAQS
jgi:probable addiction module antidote protein